MPPTALPKVGEDAPDPNRTDIQAPWLSKRGSASSNYIAFWSAASLVVWAATALLVKALIPSDPAALILLPNLGEGNIWPATVYATVLFYELVKQVSGGSHHSRRKMILLPLTSVAVSMLTTLSNASGFTPVLLSHNGSLFWPVRLVSCWINSAILMCSLWMMGSNSAKQFWYCLSATCVLFVSGISAILAPPATWAAVLSMATFSLCYLVSATFIFKWSGTAFIHSGSCVRPVSQSLLRGITLLCWTAWPLASIVAWSGIWLSFQQELWVWNAVETASTMLVCGVFVSMMESYNEFVATQAQRSLEGLYREKIQQLESATEQKRDLLAAVTHELRTPLNGIIGLMDSVLAAKKSNTVDAMLDVATTVRDCGKRLHGLVSQLLKSANKPWEALADKENCTPVTTGQVLQEVFVLMQPLFPKGVQVVKNIPEKTPMILVEYDNMMQVFYNILGNAVKFCTEGHISVTVRQAATGEEEGSVYVDIQDSGIGIPADKLVAIFEPFTQVDQTGTRKFGGVGLGLSLSKQIVEAHGGCISVKSTLGVGTTFTVRLPIAGKDDLGFGTAQMTAEQPSSESTMPGKTEPAAAGGISEHVATRRISSTTYPASPKAILTSTEEINLEEDASQGASTAELMCQTVVLSRKQRLKERIEVLCVDDDDVNQMVVQMMFQGDEHVVVTMANDGQEALDILETSFKKSGYHDFPDLILMDLMMPRITGIEATQEIRKKYPDAPLPIIMLSANGESKVIIEGFDAGCNDYITKPFNRMEVLARTGSQIAALEYWLDQAESLQKEQLLRMILPDSIIKRLNQGIRPIADEHESVTVLFSDIVGFTELASSVETEELINILDTLFAEFDMLTDELGVYKVETIGDAYMVVAGHSQETSPAERIVQMGERMIQAAQRVSAHGRPLRIRVGIHTGPAHAGVVGHKCPRYCFFGDTINTASRMESTGYASAIHISEATKLALEGTAYRFHDLGISDIKGKGKMSTFLVKSEEWQTAVEVHAAAKAAALAKASILAPRPVDTADGSCQVEELAPPPAVTGQPEMPLPPQATSVPSPAEDPPALSRMALVADSLESLGSRAMEALLKLEDSLNHMPAGIATLADLSKEQPQIDRPALMEQQDFVLPSSIRTKPRRMSALSTSSGSHSPKILAMISSDEYEEQEAMRLFLLEHGLSHIAPKLEASDVTSLSLLKELGREELMDAGVHSIGAWKRLRAAFAAERA